MFVRTVPSQSTVFFNCDLMLFPLNKLDKTSLLVFTVTYLSREN